MELLQMAANSSTVEPFLNASTEFRFTIFYIRCTFLPVILIGTIFNVFNFIALTHKDSKNQSIAVYLLALSSVDLSLMYVELLRMWIESWPTQKTFMNNTYCKIMNYITYSVRDISNWLIVCLAVERLVAVARFKWTKTYCQVKTARSIVLSLALFFAILNCHHLVYAESRESKNLNVCWESVSSKGGAIVWATFSVLFGNSVLIVVTVLNVLIIILIKRHQRVHARRWLRQNTVTRMLIVISLLLLFCETPKIVTEITLRLWKEGEENETARIILNITFLISGVNHALNFIVYVFSSSKYRGIFLKACREYKTRMVSMLNSSELATEATVTRVSNVQRSKEKLDEKV